MSTLKKILVIIALILHLTFCVIRILFVVALIYVLLNLTYFGAFV